MHGYTGCTRMSGVFQSMLNRFYGAVGRPLLVEALRTQSVIGDDAALAESIAETALVEAFEPGGVVMRELGVDNDICFILAGVVSIRVLGRKIAVRTAGQHVGEMALVDPGKRRSATVVAEDGVVIARLSERSFTSLAESYPRLWRNVARELTHRLRQRNKFVEPVNSRPVLFVGCSAESIPIAYTIQEELKCDPIDVTVWTDGVFTASTFPIESLEQVLRSVDFAALVLSPDDTVVSRGTMTHAPRDNIILELGLFMGALGHSLTFLIYPRDIDIKIPTDLAGITPLTYSPETESDASKEMASVCSQMRTSILTVGPR